MLDNSISIGFCLFLFMFFLVYYSPFFGHILEGWAKRDNPNVLFLFYEDMKRVNWIGKNQTFGLFGNVYCLM